MNTLEPLKGKTLLVVEDEADLREPLVSEFQYLGCKVFQASNGADAFAIVCNEQIDLVISDIRMPGGDGIQLLKNIRARSGEIPAVMLMTGFSDVSAEESYALGAEAILTKPFDLNEMEQAAERILTPPAERWANPDSSDTVSKHVERAMESLLAAEARGSLSVGSGGFFIDTQDLSVGRTVTFHIRFESGSLLVLEGSGVVRWVRRYDSDGLKAGSGIEFRFLPASTREAVIRLMKALGRRSFLPRLPS